MKKVVALKAFSTGTLTMEEKQVADIEDALADSLIAQGVCADAAVYFGGGGGGALQVSEENIGGGKMQLSDSYTTIKNGLQGGPVMLAGGRGIIYAAEEAMTDGGIVYSVFGMLRSGSVNPEYVYWESMNANMANLTRSL